MLYKKSAKTQFSPLITMTLFSFVIFILFNTKVYAGAGIFEVIHPDIEKGMIEIEALNGVSLDSVEDGEERSVHELAIGYGVTHNWKLTAAVEIANPQSESFEVEAFELESLYLFGKKNKRNDDHHGHDHGHSDSPDKHSGTTFGLFAALEIPREGGFDEGALELGPVFETKLGGINWVGNVLLEVPFEEGDPGLIYATQFVYPINNSFSVGLESFGEFEGVFDGGDEEELFAGPSIYFKTKLNSGSVIEPRLALLFGLTDESADAVLSLNVEYKIGKK